MYLGEEIIDEKRIQETMKSWLPNVDIKEPVTKIEIWYSSFSDPGEDFTEFCLFSGESKLKFRTTGF